MSKFDSDWRGCRSWTSQSFSFMERAKLPNYWYSRCWTTHFISSYCAQTTQDYPQASLHKSQKLFEWIWLVPWNIRLYQSLYSIIMKQNFTPLQNNKNKSIFTVCFEIVKESVIAPMIQWKWQPPVRGMAKACPDKKGN